MPSGSETLLKFSGVGTGVSSIVESIFSSSLGLEKSNGLDLGVTSPRFTWQGPTVAACWTLKADPRVKNKSKLQFTKIRFILLSFFT